MSEVKRYVLSSGFPREHEDGKYVLASDYDALKARSEEFEELLSRALPAVRTWTGMVRRSQGHHSAKSADAANLVHDIRVALYHTKEQL